MKSPRWSLPATPPAAYLFLVRRKEVTSMKHSAITLSLAAILLVMWFGLAPMSVLAMDQVRIETRVDAAVARFGVTGKGVIVALMDRGIDWKNNDFRNSDGTTRIKYIFDLTDDTGASDPGNPYGLGTIYTESQINAALTGGPTLATRDAVGHGTTTSAIPAGNGRNSAALKYRGIATDATIVSVKITSDGAPAHDGQPAEAPFYDPTRIPIAIDFIKDKAAALGMPCVMLLNLGSTGGATDGTSTLARKIDSVVGPGVHGLLFVTGPGDDGGTPNHSAATVPAGGAISTQLRKSTDSTQPLYFDMWYPGLDQSNVNVNRLNITIQTPSGTFGPYLSPTTNDDSDFQQTSDFTYYHQGGNVNFSGATSGKREVYIIFNGGVGTYTVTATAANSTSGGHFDATLNPSYIINGPDPSRFLTNMVAGSSIWDGASAFYNICPGDYVHRTSWTDIDGNSQSFTSQGNIGEIWQGSAAGPTFDGRLGIDVCAPGDSLFTTYNPESYWATFRFNLIQDGSDLYGRASAVSAAAPIATGILALMLQMDHYLDAPTAKQILQQTARSDSFTGAVPNSTWGYGKIDAYAALSRLELKITAIQKMGNDMHIKFTSIAGATYRVEYRADLANGSWQTLVNNISGTGSVIDITDTGGATQGKRFYRAVLP
jgi:minor extracellular serine protease Vpr